MIWFADQSGLLVLIRLRRDWQSSAVAYATGIMMWLADQSGLLVLIRFQQVEMRLPILCCYIHCRNLNVACRSRWIVGVNLIATG